MGITCQVTVRPKLESLRSSSSIYNVCLIPPSEFEEGKFCFLSKYGIKVKEIKNNPIEEFYYLLCLNMPI